MILLALGYKQPEQSFILNKAILSLWEAFQLIYLHIALLNNMVEILFLFGLAE